MSERGSRRIWTAVRQAMLIEGVADDHATAHADIVRIAFEDEIALFRADAAAQTAAAVEALRDVKDYIKSGGYGLAGARIDAVLADLSAAAEAHDKAVAERVLKVLEPAIVPILQSGFSTASSTFLNRTVRLRDALEEARALTTQEADAKEGENRE